MDCCCFVFAAVVVIGCGNCGLWHIFFVQLPNNSRLWLHFALVFVSACILRHWDSTWCVLHYICACESWIWFSVVVSVFKLEQQQARALGLSRNKVETPSRDRHTCTHPQQNRQVFITRICVKSRYTYQMYAYFLCFLIYVINGGRNRVCVCVCVIAENCHCLQWCVGQPAEPVFDLLVV